MKFAISSWLCSFPRDTFRYGKIGAGVPMKIELKSIKTYPSMSEETTAFDATLYVDGVKVGTAKNNGRGGANQLVCDHALLAKMDAYCEALPDHADMPMDMDYYISILVTQEEVKKQAKSMMKDRVVFENAKGELMQTNKMTPEAIAAYKPRPGDMVLDEAGVLESLRKLNDMPDFGHQVQPKATRPLNAGVSLSEVV